MEISQYAFQACSITRVIIYAKIRSINFCAFRFCTKLKYINIPSSVTFLGELALYVGEAGVTEPGEILVEFNKGRTQNFYIDEQNFARRETVYVIYPYKYIPSCQTTYAFAGVNYPYICAPSVFTFYTKKTITDSSKCPRPVFKEREVHTISIQLRRLSILILSIIIITLSPTINIVIITAISSRTTTSSKTKSTAASTQKNE